MSTFERVVKVIINVKKLEENADIQEDTSFREDLAMDSLDILLLASAIDDEFGVEIPETDFASIITVEDIVAYIGNSTK